MFSGLKKKKKKIILRLTVFSATPALRQDFATPSLQQTRSSHQSLHSLSAGWRLSHSGSFRIHHLSPIRSHPIIKTLPSRSGRTWTSSQHVFPLCLLVWAFFSFPTSRLDFFILNQSSHLDYRKAAVRQCLRLKVLRQVIWHRGLPFDFRSTAERTRNSMERGSVRSARCLLLIMTSSASLAPHGRITVSLRRNNGRLKLRRKHVMFFFFFFYVDVLVLTSNEHHSDNTSCIIFSAASDVFVLRQNRVRIRDPPSPLSRKSGKINIPVSG